MPRKRICLALLAGALFHGALWADTLELNPDRPSEYTVVKGDTLWDISAKFLRDPWRWPEIWNLNEQIANPHLIYPGDIIHLVYVDGKPVLQIKRGARVMKLSPHAHSTPLGNAIPTIDPGVISQFLGQPRILTKEELDGAGYIVASEEKRLISGANSRVFARNLRQDSNRSFAIYRLGNVYRSDRKPGILGYEAIQVADARLEGGTDPATLRITKAHRETMVEDIVLPVDSSAITQGFIPSSPPDTADGRIISILDGIALAGQYQTVVLDLGHEDNIERGHVLAVRTKGIQVQDRHAQRVGSSTVTLPEDRSALLMVYRAFERVSYALVMESQQDIRIGDRVTAP